MVFLTTFGTFSFRSRRDKWTQHAAAPLSVTRVSRKRTDVFSSQELRSISPSLKYEGNLAPSVEGGCGEERAEPERVSERARRWLRGPLHRFRCIWSSRKHAQRRSPHAHVNPLITFKFSLSSVRKWGAPGAHVQLNRVLQIKRFGPFINQATQIYCSSYNLYSLHFLPIHTKD